jgi:predicted enzyme related to lactoylglutathione lyase
VAQPNAELSLIILAVSDLARSVEFYRYVFGWQRTVDTQFYVEFELKNGLGLGLYQREGFARNVGQMPVSLAQTELASTEIYFRTHEPHAFIARLEQIGARILSPISLRDWGDEAAYFSDSDGNVIVIARAINV